LEERMGSGDELIIADELIKEYNEVKAKEAIR
jgi:hypothetical protein